MNHHYNRLLNSSHRNRGPISSGELIAVLVRRLQATLHLLNFGLVKGSQPVVVFPIGVILSTTTPACSVITKGFDLANGLFLDNELFLDLLEQPFSVGENQGHSGPVKKLGMHGA